MPNEKNVKFLFQATYLQRQKIKFMNNIEEVKNVLYCLPVIYWHQNNFFVFHK